MQSDPTSSRDGAARREAEVRGRPHARVTLVRHGEPDWTPGDGAAVTDPSLTSLGLAQARATARLLARERIDAIYVSPYRRALETAAALAEVTGTDPVTVDGLAEVGIAVDGMTQQEVDRYFVEGARRPLDQHWEGWPGAETFHAFHGRVTAAVTDVLERHGCRPERRHDFTIWQLPEKKPRIVLVAHCGTNAVALTHLLDVRPVPWEWMRFESELCAFSVLQAREIGPDGFAWSLQSFNQVDHLDREGLR
jgi:probable phosphoglycerate mutase